MKFVKKYVLALFVLACSLSYAQAPQAMSYQAIAYDINGQIVNTVISVKFSILNGSNTGPVIYAETYMNVMPTNEGVFSLNIGQGTAVTGLFSEINWGVGSKFLQVEIDPSSGNGGSYTIIGVNQLVSVPYALYTENVNANSGMVTLKNMDALRDFADFDPELDDPTVYVKGYLGPSDGGGGTFIFKRYTAMGIAEHPTEDLGVFINSDTYEEKGIWIRQFSGDIDVRWYGVFGEGSPDPGLLITERIQKAIDYANKSNEDISGRPYGYNSSNTVFFPNGNYLVNQLVLKSGVSLKGSSKKYTVINSLDDGSNALFILDAGPVEDVHISHITLQGLPMGRTKACFYISGTQPKAGKGCGLWASSFKDLFIRFFNGDSFYFEGGTGTDLSNIEYSKVNQFLVFENVHVESVGQLRTPENLEFRNTAHALSIAGLNGQFSFNSCRFDGGEHIFGDTNSNQNYFVSGINVYLGPVNEEAFGLATPAVINFNSCTFQHGEIGIYINSCRGINIYGNWFENFEGAIRVMGKAKGENREHNWTSKSINIMNNQYGRSAGRMGTLPDDFGSVITYQNAQLNVMNNYVADHDLREKVSFIRLEDGPNQENIPIDWLENSGVNTIGNTFLQPNQGITWGLDKVLYAVDIPNDEIIGENARLLTAYIEGTKVVNKITSLIGAAEMLNIRCGSGRLVFVEGDNIDLGINNNNSHLTLNAGGVATFVKVEDMNVRGYATYRLVSYND